MSGPEEVVPAFVMAIYGQDPGEFDSLVDAMSWAEQFDSPTGGIYYDGTAVIVYRNGAIDLANVSQN